MASSDVPVGDDLTAVNVHSHGDTENLVAMPANTLQAGDETPDTVPQGQEIETGARSGSAEDGDETSQPDLEDVGEDGEDGTPPTTAKLTPKGEAWASSKVMDELRVLQDKLAEMQRHTGARLDFEALAAEWDEARERLGPEREQRDWDDDWENRVNMAVEDGTSQFHGQRWFSRVDQDFSRRMEETRRLDEELLRHRMRWEGRSPDSYRRRLRQRDQFRPGFGAGMGFGAGLGFRQDENRYFEQLDEVQRFGGDIVGHLRDWRSWAHEDIDSEYHNGRDQRDRLHDRVERAFDREMRRHELKPRFQRFQRRDTFVAPDSPEENTARSRASTPEILNSGPPSIGQPDVSPALDYTVSELNPVKWSAFKDFGASQEKRVYAIDVLEGEPVIVWDNWDPSRYVRSRYMSRRARAGIGGRLAGHAAAVEQTTAPPPAELLQPGKALLPERIRINSPHLLQVLAKIHGSGFESADGQSHVLVRPFRVLAHYETQLRDWYKKLANKFAPQEADSREPGDVTTTKATAPEAGDSDEAEAASGARTAAEEGDKDGEEDPNDDSTSSIAFDHLGLLLRFVDANISQKLAYLGGHECRKVAFDDLWHIFRPGIDVIGINGKQAYRVVTMVSSPHRVIKPFRDRDDDEDSARFDETPITLNCVYLDFDGQAIGPVQVAFEIKRFDNLREVTSLPVFPLRYHPMDKPPPPVSTPKKGAQPKKEADQTTAPEAPMPPGERLRQYLVARGERFLRAAAVEHMNYEGPAIEAKDDTENQVTVESQVVVDFQTTFSSLEDHQRLKVTWPPSLSSLTSAVVPEPETPGPCKQACCRGENVHDDIYVDTKRNSDHLERLYPKARDIAIPVLICPRPLEEINTEEYFLDESDMVIMSYRVFGFVLRSRKWAQLDLTYLSEIKHPLRSTRAAEAVLSPAEEAELMAKTAFGRLVLPEGHKTLVRSLTAQHFRDKKDPSRGQSNQADIVRGKGKGLIILLHGAPGVGKTTTAEGVAELFRKPLFQITCGDLGTTSKEVEKALETNFDLANKWDCILLLDEADVFLAARTKADFQRNGLVAVFLRVLEYYAGILFLTTNRIGDFDEAFASRIHISLYYPPLDRENTLKVFTLNLDLIQERIRDEGRTVNIDRVTIGDYAGKHYDRHKSARWNGRQIRNACQTALALAEFQAQGNSHTAVLNANAVITLDITHFDVVFKAYRKFKRYLKRVYGVHEAQRANEAEVRAPEAAPGGESGSESDGDAGGGANNNNNNNNNNKKNALKAMKKGRGRDRGHDAEPQPAIPARQPFPGPPANPGGTGLPAAQYVPYAAPPPAQPGYPYAQGGQLLYHHGQAGYREGQGMQAPQQHVPPQQGWTNMYGPAPPPGVYAPQPPGQGQAGGEHHGGHHPPGHGDMPAPPPGPGG